MVVCVQWHEEMYPSGRMEEGTDKKGCSGFQTKFRDRPTVDTRY